MLQLYRNVLLGVADAQVVSHLIKSHGRKLGVSRFVAGETLEEVLGVRRRLQESGLATILDLLGEFVADEAGAEAMTRDIVHTLEALGLEPGEAYMSVKPTQLGLGIDLELAFANAQNVAETARQTGAQICLDMENAPYVDGTLALYKRLSRAGFAHVSTVLQSYLKRTPKDLEVLLEAVPHTTLRLVKGAYREDAALAFQDKAKVDAAYRELLYKGLEGGAKINIATHDETIIHEAEAYIQSAKLTPEHYEFQFLYGVKPALQKRLAARGHKVRVYIPYGADWYGYFSRRLAERPANLLFVLRGLFG